MRHSFICGLTLALMALSCKNPEVQEAVPFPDVTVPGIITDIAEAREYLAMHYWDGLADKDRSFPSDSILVSGVRKEEVEKKFADFALLLSSLELEYAEKAMCGLFDRLSQCEEADTSSSVFETVSALASKYLYDPNSPLRNEDIYQPFASRLADSPFVSEDQRMTYRLEASLCSLNRTGTKAADFMFSDMSGRSRYLYDLPEDYVLLFFSNPGCEACGSIYAWLISSPLVGELVESGRLAIANIYIDDNLEDWFSHARTYPENWYNGYDQDHAVRTNLLYNVRAIPSLYLLGKDKTVILKDAPLETVRMRLEEIALE